MNTKAKGTKGERELIHLFNQNGWSAIRTAGSGSQHYPAPDILAGNAMRRVAIECKVTKEQKKYFPDEEIVQLRTFAQKFGAESWIGVRFPREPWYFLMLEDLERTGECWAVSLEKARIKGLKVEELLEKDLPLFVE
ncbi:Holliday junction resolvase [Candidatus Woesearchaeota archaeon]|nr:Holliday junction resolvase [Candidatus Woesearchaeota archaeon]